MMANILDYLTWRGDLPLSAVPWTPVDALLLANLSYNDLPPVAATDRKVWWCIPLIIALGRQEQMDIHVF